MNPYLQPRREPCDGCRHHAVRCLTFNGTSFPPPFPPTQGCFGKPKQPWMTRNGPSSRATALDFQRYIFSSFPHRGFPDYRATSIPGIAFSSSATPAEVTVVPPNVISLRFLKPTRCLIPASEIFVP